MPPSKVLVTGASGFLGGTISRALHSQSCQLSLITNTKDLAAKTYSDRQHCIRLPDRRFAQIIASEKPDWLIHCAGSASVRASIADPKADYYSNVVVTRFVYNTLAEFSPATRVVNLSSAAVYGEPQSLPITSETMTSPVSPYGRHKRECELISQQFGYSHGIETTNLRIFSSYGPGLRKQVLWDIYKKSLAGPVVTLFGDGTETRDFIFSADIAAIVQNLIARPRSETQSRAQYLNIASGRSVTIRHLARRFLDILNSRAELRFNGRSAAGDPKHWAVDATPITRYGLLEPTDLQKGLSIYARWIRSLTGNTDADRILAAAG